MNRLFYPALFHKAEEGGFWISFPDIPECLTQGDDMAQAYEMAVDALGLALVCREKEGQPIPAASNPAAIVPEPGSFLAVIEFDMLAYKKRTNSKAVKKTLSIPEWLNEAAMSMDLNFSQVLQEALLAKLQLLSLFLARPLAGFLQVLTHSLLSRGSPCRESGPNAASHQLNAPPSAAAPPCSG